MRFVHTADWQIGKPFVRFGDKAEAFRAARLDAVEAIGRLAVAEGAAHVLVAGDVFDSDSPANVTLRAPVERMRGFSAVIWHLLPGNHDAHRPGGPWERLCALGLPANVVVHLSAEPVALGGHAVLLPAPLTSRHETRDLTARMDEAATPPGTIRIGLAHGAVTRFGTPGDDGEAANQIDPGRAEKAGLDYLALGDWHRTREIGPRTWYAGTPEPDRHDSQTVGTALLVTVPQAGAPPTVEPRHVGTYRWAAETLDLADADTLAAREALLRTAHDPVSKLVLKLKIGGALSIAARRALDEWLERLQASVFHLDAALALAIRPDAADLERIDFDGVLRRVAETLKARAADPALTAAERQTAEDALLALYLEATA
ncbi:DNA repair exonuclease [Rhodoplanes sp. TEM]|uniref:DNA repair exonuclease n=1 Tax=Rhodoplanes tepidamans TaxID=200616 RepID=A0ABT5JA17_RHOTP|nr:MULTISPECIES: DNA repair exonuclease [Rhodoplanes]MDC7786139.1 DNA repair exonuclease [Rhodoplanes tepidamans]MDC7982806.1 DNA repair exonuclease [Rhodoplanes sp. TEM]MDQ0357196.1 DNA repair exonuclease SbcCD nuclease subunit [Rhodoplanes tepidamans]